MTERQREQVDFEFYDDGTAPGWWDRPPGHPAPALRPDQMLLPIPALDDTFVVPRWSTDDVPPGWAFLAAEMDAHRLTALRGRFMFRRDADRQLVAVWVQWSSEWSRLTATSGEPDTGEPFDQAMDSDMRLIEEAVLRRAERYVDLLTMVGAEAATPDAHQLLLEAIGISPNERLM
jgi:hypothetical protein